MNGWMVGVMLAVSLWGCGAAAARLGETTPQGGEVVLEGAYMGRVSKAMVVMAGHCDGPFAVLDESGRRADAPTKAQRRVEFVCTERIETARRD